MSNECCSCKTKAAYVVGILGSLLVVAWLAWFVVQKTKPAPLTEDRYALRRKNLTELKAANTETLDNYGVLDAGKQLVRLPISNAMQVVLQEWQNPKAGRSNLIARVEKATAPAPKAPEKKSEFE
jgi:hypothetical protein